MKVQIQALCKSSMHLLIKVGHGKPFQIISLCLFNPSPFNFSDYIVLHEALHNCTTSSFELNFFEQFVILSFHSTRIQHHKQHKSLYGICLITMYELECLIGRTLWRGITYDESPSLSIPNTI
jgi:hypothetical protein